MNESLSELIANNPLIHAGAPIPRPYRVLLVDLTPGFGGVEIRVLLLAQALQGLVADCRVATSYGSVLHERLRAKYLPVEPIHGKLKDPRMVFQLWQIIRHHQYQVVDAHNVPSILWGHLAAVWAGAAGRVTTIQSFYEREYGGIKGWMYQGILAVDRMFIHHYVNVAEGLQQQAVARGDGARNSLIHNVVPASQPGTGKDQHRIAQWGFTLGDFVLAIVARLEPVKAHADLLNAFALLRDLPHVKLLVVGAGSTHAALVAQTTKLGLGERVYFAGFCADVSVMLQSVDCACLVSHSEGLPHAILEAALEALPIIATAVGGMQTLLTHGETAFLVAPHDPAAIAAGIRWVVEHPAEAGRMGHAARELVQRSFSVEQMVAQTLAVYDRLMR